LRRGEAMIFGGIPLPEILGFGHRKMITDR
jgi:hypothetical protein